LRRLVEVLVLAVNTGCDASAALALEAEHVFSSAVQIWPRNMPLQWAELWGLQRWRKEVDARFVREASHNILSQYCFECLRHYCRAGAARFAAEHLPNHTRPPIGKLGFRDAILAALPSWLSQHGLRKVGSGCGGVVPPGLACGIISHSSQGQDLWVLSTFAARLPSGHGFFLEVGAHHPETMSNTLLLEQVAGWDGVCVEPFPRGDWSTRRALLVQAAVGEDDSWAPFFRPGHMWGGRLDVLNESERGEMWRFLKEPTMTVVDVRTKSLASILGSARLRGRAVPRVIHYVSLDTEGSELEILRQFPFEVYLPLSFTIEHHFKEPKRTQTQEFLLGRGYVLDRTVEHDDFFILRDSARFLVWKVQDAGGTAGPGG